MRVLIRQNVGINTKIVTIGASYGPILDFVYLMAAIMKMATHM